MFWGIHAIGMHEGQSLSLTLWAAKLCKSAILPICLAVHAGMTEIAETSFQSGKKSRPLGDDKRAKAQEQKTAKQEPEIRRQHLEITRENPTPTESLNPRPDSRDGPGYELHSEDHPNECT